MVAATYTNLTLANSALKNAGGNMTVNGVLNIGANQGNDRGHLELTRNYASYANAKYSDSAGYNIAFPNALTDANTALKDNTGVYNNLDSHILTLGASATVTGTGDVTGKVRRTTIVSGVTYAFGNTNTQLTFNNSGGGNLPTQITVVSTRGVEGRHADKGNTVNRLYQVLRTGGTSPTTMTIRLAYDETELNANTEASLVLWDHHIPYNGITPHEHGKTNQSVGNNWVELTSHGVLYLAAESDVNFTKYWMLSNKVSADTTWLGAVPNGVWTTPSNWNIGSVPPSTAKIVIPDAALTPNDPNLAGTVSAGTLLIQPGGIVEGGSGTLVLSGGPAINGGAGTWLNQGTFNAGTSTVVFNNADATIAGTTTFHNVTVNATHKATVQQDADITIAGALTNNGTLDAASFTNTVTYTGASQNIAAPNGTVTGYSNLVVNGTGTAVAPASLIVRGNYTTNQVVDYTTNTTTLTMSGAAAQNIAGSDLTAIPLLAINNSTGVSMLRNVTVSSNLTLTSGNLNIGANTLALNGNFSGSGAAALSANGLTSNITIGGSGAIGNLFFNETSNGVTNKIATFTLNRSGQTASLGNNLVVRTSLMLTNGKFGMNGQTLTIDSGNVTSDGINSLVGSATSNLTISGTGSINNLFLDQTTPGTTNAIGTLTMDRSGQTVSLGNNLEVGTSLILTNGKFGINGQALTIRGNITSSASNALVGSSTSQLTLAGSGAMNNLFFDQITPGTTNRLQHLTYNRTSGTMGLGNALQVTGTVTPTAGTLASNGLLTLVSNSLGTARIANGGCTTCSYLTGNVNVQRFIPGVARRWRFLGSTVQNTTLADWKNETFITGTGGATNGFDASGSNAASVFSYNETLSGGVNDGWTAATNITNAILAGKGYRLFIRGDRTDNGRLTGTVANQNEVTLDLVGVPNQGNITLPVSYTSLSVDSNDGWNLVSNPYASSYDWKAFYNADSGTASCSGIEPTIWVLNGQNGGYFSYNAKSDVGSLLGGTLPAGASFWVKAFDTSPSLMFKEQYKVATNPISLFKTNVSQSFNIQLYYDSITWDDVLVKYKTGATADLDGFDIRKLNGTITVSAYGNDNQQLALSCRPPVNNSIDTIKLNIVAPKGKYKLRFNNSEALVVNQDVVLVDTYHKTVTDIKTNSEYSFKIESEMAASFGLNRFYVLVGNTLSGTEDLLQN